MKVSSKAKDFDLIGLFGDYINQASLVHPLGKNLKNVDFI